MELVWYILFSAAVIYIVARALIGDYFAGKSRFQSRINEYLMKQGGPHGQ
jgi:hypothetical protein